jgi:hypothetical protein
MSMLLALGIWRIRMQELLGRTFSVGNGEYRVVDVRQLTGELMVYAEELTSTVEDQRRPKRAAFHYGDIASRLDVDNQTA